MNLVVVILIGVAIGGLVELVLPRHHLSELILTMLLGVAGAMSARLIGERVGWYGTEEPFSFIAGGIGAAVVLLGYVIFFRPRQSH